DGLQRAEDGIRLGDETEDHKRAVQTVLDTMQDKREKNVRKEEETRDRVSYHTAVLESAKRIEQTGLAAEEARESLNVAQREQTERAEEAERIAVGKKAVDQLDRKSVV